MSKSVYLVNPASDFPTYFSAEAFGLIGKPATLMADLAIPTIAAMAPGNFNVELCDQNISPVDFDVDVDFVGITGKITQWGQMARIAREFRSRGKVVLIGGPYASLCPEVARPYCDILVRGEMEDIAGQLFSDLGTGSWKDEYVGNRPELDRSPIPAWSKYRNDRAIMGTLQTSRGCPFECEFCDVIQYLGRKQRHKPIDQVLQELDVLYRYGYRSVFLADDNFTSSRGRAKELLAALQYWNRRQEKGRVSFTTQLSIDAAKDEELLQMCADAGLTHVFIGIETPNEDSLRETRKRQNLGISLSQQVQRFLDKGIAVTGGMIVGFDSDGPDIFERQYEFAMSMPIPIFSLGALVAPAATPLHDRMAKEGRLFDDGAEVAAMPWSTNIVPRQMTRQRLLDGTRWLCNKLYDPQAFAERCLHFIEKLGELRHGRPAQERTHPGELRGVDLDSLEVLASVPQLGPQEKVMWSRITRAAAGQRDKQEHVVGSLLRYMQIRHMYDLGQLWEPQFS